MSAEKLTSSPSNLDHRLDAYQTQARATTAKGLPRWSAFAAAAGSSLAFATAADADIIYSGKIDKTITLNTQTQKGVLTSAIVPIAGGHALRMTLAKSFTLNTASHLFLKSAVGLGVADRRTSVNANASLAGPFTFGLRRFASGSKISFFQPVSNFGELFQRATLGAKHYTGGTWPTGQPGFAGIGFQTTNGGFDLGWARLEWSFNPSTHIASLELFDFAYNNDPDATILAGQTAPEPGTLGLMLLALGSSGVLAWRRRLKGTAKAS